MTTTKEAQMATTLPRPTPAAKLDQDALALLHATNDAERLVGELCRDLDFDPYGEKARLVELVALGLVAERRAADPRGQLPLPMTLASVRPARRPRR